MCVCGTKLCKLKMVSDILDHSVCCPIYFRFSVNHLMMGFLGVTLVVRYWIYIADEVLKMTIVLATVGVCFALFSIFSYSSDICSSTCSCHNYLFILFVCMNTYTNLSWASLVFRSKFLIVRLFLTFHFPK